MRSLNFFLELVTQIPVLLTSLIEHIVHLLIVLFVNIVRFFKKKKGVMYIE